MATQIAEKWFGITWKIQHVRALGFSELLFYVYEKHWKTGYH